MQDKKQRFEFKYWITWREYNVLQPRLAALLSKDPHTDENGEQKFLTKGDNNSVNDRGQYNQEDKQLWLKKEDVMGRVVGFLPYIGIVTIVLTDYPAAKFALIGLMGVFVLLSKDGK